ncbi:ATP-binding cassette domain-containing protein [Mycolicibacterium sp. XJ775]
MTNPAVELAGLSIGYRHRRQVSTVATGLDAQARRGELTVLIGPNGAGKSTLIRTLAGLQPALGGQVLLDGTDLTKLPRDELARQVGVVLTERIDPGLLSARELVGLGRIPHLGLAARLGRADEEIVDWALAATGAGHLASRSAAELSDGECQRVLTARALAQQPGLLILDEPTAFLDVSARAALFGLLRKLARDQQLAVVLSTHDLELALRVADRVWLMDRSGTLTDTIGEELMVSGRISAMFGNDTLHFDPASGMFTIVDDGDHRTARIEAAEPLRSAVTRVLSREGWRDGDSAEIILTATDVDTIAVRTVAGAEIVALRDLPQLLRSVPAGSHCCVQADQVASALAQLSTVSSYFAVSTGQIPDGDWRPVAQLYTDEQLLAGVVERVRERIGAPDLRVAVSTFYLGFAARLWSIGLGGLAEHGLLVDLHRDQLWFSESGGSVRLHLRHPIAWRATDSEPLLADMILRDHLAPLVDAVRRLGPISQRLLLGNAASALLGAARALSRHRGGELAADPGWGLARSLFDDERLSSTICFNESETDYRRTSCCLFYRTPDAGLCGDCALTHKPEAGTRLNEKGSP